MESTHDRYCNDVDWGGYTKYMIQSGIKICVPCYLEWPPQLVM